jgi:site-specific recombinase XerD
MALVQGVIDTDMSNFTKTEAGREGALGMQALKRWAARLGGAAPQALAAGTINGRLAAVRRLAYEAADAGLLSPEVAAGIRRVKGIKELGVRLGNWLTAEAARRFWQSPPSDTLKGKRDRAILPVPLGCGLRRRELADLEFT